MTVYIVTEGDYSDYHIEEVFSTIEAAEKYIEIHNHRWDDYCIEEYEVDNVTIESMIEVEAKTPYYYIFQFNKDGKLISDDRFAGISCEAPDDIWAEGIWRLQDKNPISWIYVRVYENGKTYDQCLKIAQDKRAQYLAEKEELF